jgi:hypothetical protein
MLRKTNQADWHYPKQPFSDRSEKSIISKLKMKNTFEEMAANRLEETTITFPIYEPIHASVFINIPEILQHLEDADFEDWLTAALYENASQMPLRHLCADGACRSEIRSVDLWMVEITRRTGRIWNGKFQVEFTEVQNSASKADLSTKNYSGELFFALDTESAEIFFITNVDR